MQSDQSLMARILDGDADAFEVLFARYGEVIHRHVLGMVRDPSAAEDIAQEVFIRLWTRARQWRGQAEVRPWLLRIATNLALNHLRSLRRRPQQPLEIPQDRAGEGEQDLIPSWMVDAASLAPEAFLESLEQREMVRRRVDELPEDKREILRLVYEDEMSIHDVADLLDIPEGTAKSRLYYARMSLARRWGAHGKGSKEDS